MTAYKVFFHITTGVVLASIAYGYDWGTNPGDGSPGNPYQISTPDHLMSIGNDPVLLTKHFILVNDIIFDPNHNPDHIFTKALIAQDIDNTNMHYDGTGFSGIFDGDHHRILNFKIDGSMDRHLSLFGGLDHGTVQNLGMENIFLTGNDAAGLVSQNLGGVIYNCYTKGQIIGNQSTLGGLVSFNTGCISKCYSACMITGTGAFASCLGGLVANNSGTVFYSYATGSVTGYDSIGGLCGINEGNILNCYSTGDVEGTNWVGGLVGRSMGGYYTSCSISNCYSTGDVSGSSETGGLVGFLFWAAVSNCYWDLQNQTHGISNSIGYIDDGTVTNVLGRNTAQMQTQSTYLNAHWDFFGESANGTCESWRMPTGGGYPVLSVFSAPDPVSLAGNGTFANPYRIGTAVELGMASWYPGHSSFRLADNIDLSSIFWSTTILPSLTGTFDGDGHTIKHLQITGCGYLGLIGTVEEGGQVRDLYLSNASVEGHHCIGLLVGMNRGSLKNCVCSGSVRGSYLSMGGLTGENNGTISFCHTTVSAEGEDRVGGLVGFSNGGSISASSSSSSVSGDSEIGGLAGRIICGAIGDCYSQGTVEGYSRAGGLVGFAQDNPSIIVNCYSACTVSGGYIHIGGLVGESNGVAISHCFATGDVNGTYNVGGLIGKHSVSPVTNCYSVGSVNGYNASGGLIGDNYHSTLSTCYSKGTVTGSINVGGLIGRDIDYASVIYSCYFMNTAGPDNGYGEPLDDLNMKIQGSFVGWDFVGEDINGTEDIWTICEGTNYPWFVSQVLKGDFVCPDGVGIEDADAFGGCWLAQVDLNTELEDDGDTVVGLPELARIGQYWLAVGCGECGGMDLTGDGEVTMEDLSAVAGDWLAAVYPECGMADLNGDDFVDLADWAVFAAGWMEGL